MTLTRKYKARTSKVEVPCRVCNTVVLRYPRTMPIKIYCSVKCRVAVLCGHPDRPNRGLHKCEPCYRKDRFKDPAYAEDRRQYTRSLRQKHPTRMKYYNVKHNYGITMEEYENLLKISGGKCAICKLVTEKLCVDHSHLTGKIRGMICNRCNTGLGQFKESPEIMLMAIDYITKYRTYDLTAG